MMYQGGGSIIIPHIYHVSAGELHMGLMCDHQDFARRRLPWLQCMVTIVTRTGNTCKRGRLSLSGDLQLMARFSRATHLIFI